MIYSKVIIIIISWLPRDWTGRNNRFNMHNDRHGVDCKKVVGEARETPKAHMGC